MKKIISVTPSAFALTLLAFVLCAPSARAQVNSGSNGSDGAFNPTQNVTVDMTDHPDGIYQYTTVNIPNGVTVTFAPNANNAPVVWLVQGSCTIGGTVDVSGQGADQSGSGGFAGAGGYRGGNGGNANAAGLGPGGGAASNGIPDSGSYATVGWHSSASGSPTYGSEFLLPLLGGSGGGGGGTYGGGGGGGAFLLAAVTITDNGIIQSNGGGGTGSYYGQVGGAGSGGAIRLVCTTLNGNGNISATGGGFFVLADSNIYGNGGNGRIRIDSSDFLFGGTFRGTTSQGFQPIIIPSAGQGVQIGIASIAGTAVPANPTGVLASPDVIVPGQESNPITIVINCSNLPLNTAITVVAHPANGADVQAVGTNNVGTVASSMATVSMNLPQGGGILYADCLSGTTTSTSSNTNWKTQSYAKTGLTTDGERISAVEIIAKAGAPQQTVYRTPSGKRLMIANK